MSNVIDTSPDSRTTSPLHGLRVLDFGHFIAGPLAGVFLADQGAEVISIVRPGAKSWDATTQETLSRGKQVIEVDLKTAEGLARVLALVPDCDVIIENFRPGVMDRLGLGHEVLKSINPGIVYVSLPGYSRHDPRASQRAWDSTLLAASGLFTDSAIAGAGLDLPPTHSSLPLASVYAGVCGALAALAAIYGRLKHGQGDSIEVPLMDAVMTSAAGVLFMIHDQPKRYNVPPLRRKTVESISLRKVPDVMANLLHKKADGMLPPFFRNYRCKDGELLMLCLVDNASQVDKLLKLTGLQEAAEALGFVQGDVFDIPSSKNNLNAYRGLSTLWKKLARLLEERFATDTADAWAEILLSGGVPATRQFTTTEWVATSVMKTSGIVLEERDAQGRIVYRPAPQIDVRGENIETPIRQPAARDRVSGWTSIRTFEPQSVINEDTYRGQPLEGVKVLDLCNVIAGPTAGRALAELGAEVLHVSAVRPKMGPRQTLVYGIEVNQGKRDLACDLHTSQGREIMNRLLPTMDVLLYNKPPQSAKRLGAAPEQVHAVNPRTIVTALTAFSGVIPGGWESRPGYDPILQGISGIMRRFGGEGAPKVHGIASCIDYFTGFSAAFGTLVGLLARARGSTRLVVRTSLCRSAGWVQIPFVGRPHMHPTTAGMLERGNNPLDRIYPTRDGWVHIAAPHEDWAQIRSAAGEDSPLNGDDVIGCWLSRRMKGSSTEQAVTWAMSVGFTAQAVMSARTLRRNVETGSYARMLIPATLPSGRLRQFDHPSNERYILPEALWWRPSQGRLQLQPAPGPGEHSRSILQELGYDNEAIDSLLHAGIVAERWFDGARYLPD